MKNKIAMPIGIWWIHETLPLQIILQSLVIIIQFNLQARLDVWRIFYLVIHFSSFPFFTVRFQLETLFASSSTLGMTFNWGISFQILIAKFICLPVNYWGFQLRVVPLKASSKRTNLFHFIRGLLCQRYLYWLRFMNFYIL